MSGCVPARTHKLAAVSMLLFSSSVAVRPLFTGLIRERRSACHQPNTLRRSISGRNVGPFGRMVILGWGRLPRVREETVARVRPCPGAAFVRGAHRQRQNPKRTYLELSAPSGAGSGGACEESAATNRRARNPHHRTRTPIARVHAQHHRVFVRNGWPWGVLWPCLVFGLLDQYMRL